MLIRMMYVSLASGVHGGQKTTTKICIWKSTWCNPFRDVIEGSWTGSCTQGVCREQEKCLELLLLTALIGAESVLDCPFTDFPRILNCTKRWTAAVRRENLPPNYRDSALVCSELMYLLRPKRLKRVMLIVPMLFSGGRFVVHFYSNIVSYSNIVHFLV